MTDLAARQMDARLPPAWLAEGSVKNLLGTDDQGRDMLSALMYRASGSRRTTRSAYPSPSPACAVSCGSYGLGWLRKIKDI